MKKIYWFIQQDREFGGVEMVTTKLISSLSSYYDITLVVTSKDYEHSIYELGDKVKIVYLNYDIEAIKFDAYFSKYKNAHHYLKLIALLFKMLYNTLIKRFFTRHKIKKMTTHDDILIASSLDNYMVMPRKRKVFFHYHFDANFFLSFSERFVSLFSRKPDKYIFLSKTTMDKVLKKRKFKNKDQVTYILNPTRFDSHLNEDRYNNDLVFAGRFMPQKNIFFLLKSMKILKDKNFPFTLELYGDGPLKEKIIKYINENNLNDVVFIKEPIKDLDKVLLKKDLLLMTSTYEGIPLVILEAYSQSLPIITTNWGDEVFEIVEDQKTGIIVQEFKEEKYAEEVMNLLSDNDKLHNMRINAYNKSKKHALEEVIKHWIDILK